MNKKLWKVVDWEQLCWTEGERCTRCEKSLHAVFAIKEQQHES